MERRLGFRGQPSILRFSQLPLQGVLRLAVHSHAVDRDLSGTLQFYIYVEARCVGAMTGSCVGRSNGCG